MRTYIPDIWMLFKIDSKQTTYKILGGWYGGWASSDYWKISSGILEDKLVTQHAEHNTTMLISPQYSGSEYHLHLDERFYGTSSLTYSVLEKFKLNIANSVEFSDIKITEYLTLNEAKLEFEKMLNTKIGA